ncbi:restriction endonuclease subunit S [Mammaliicoccus sciuri]|uniref:restriction endonuclease subunit S n=1 Tax=Mammaliicoccus sciuri TaxID=1296 RepID=UPI0008780C03|nr:restriction endonuclease subunit S [Mammaliicoccus sciuri]
MEYKEYELGELIEYRNEKLLIENVSLENYISTENLLPNRNGKQNAEKLPNTKSVKKYYENDILISNIRPYFKKIWQAEIPGGASNDVLILNSCSNNTTNDYLYYYLSQDKFFDYMTQTAKGTKMPRGDKKAILGYEIKVPNIKHIQNYIVNLGKNIDKKIETNKKIIANLEELSQTLFKRWFVDFEFPDENGNPYKSSGGEMIDSELGNIPRDWEVNELGNYVDIIKGLSYKGAFLDKQHERSDSFPLLSISNFNFISGFKSNKTKYYFGDYKERHLVNPGDILIAATDLTQDRKILGAPAIIPNLNKTMIFSLDVFKITETIIPKYVLYFLLQSAKYREFVEGSATGTTVIRIAKNVILKVPIVIDKDISLKFDNLIKPYMEKIEHLSQENQKLTQLRDTLLPKLMSGEIEIPDDIEVNEDELSI